MSFLANMFKFIIYIINYIYIIILLLKGAGLFLLSVVSLDLYSYCIPCANHNLKG